jgi:hypothetical protein
LGFCQKKEGHKSDDDGEEVGDAYCFVGMERTTKLVLAYHLGKRTAKATDAFIGKLAYATSDEPLPVDLRRIQALHQRRQDAAQGTAWTSPNSSRSMAHPRRRAAIQPG